MTTVIFNNIRIVELLQNFEKNLIIYTVSDFNTEINRIYSTSNNAKLVEYLISAK